MTNPIFESMDQDKLRRMIAIREAYNSKQLTIDEARERVRKEVGEVSPEEFAAAEQLVKDETPDECRDEDTQEIVHIYEGLIKEPRKELPFGHPIDAYRREADRMKELGLAKGDTDAAVAAGAHAMFLPHGLGHMMGMDVHDMESFDQINVGFDEETRPNLEQFGTNCLRMGRRLEEGFVVTDEPGIYFIPALIDEWRAKKHCAEFLNFDRLDEYKEFGGIRLEDDILITKDGCRFIGKDRIPYHPKDVEDFIAANRK